MRKKFLSEVINEHKEEIIGTTTYYNGVDSEQSNTDLILITAGVGAGKNTWVQKCLTQELVGFENILFITSRKLIKEQMLKDVDFQDNYINCQKFRTNYTITHHSLKYFFESPEKLRQLTNLNFKYIVIDEVHSLISDAGYTDTAFYLYVLINYYHTLGIKIICLSATTKDVLPLFKHFKNFKHFDFTKECKMVKPKSIKIISKVTAFNLLAQSNQKNKMIYMANSVNDICNSYYSKLLKNFKVDKNSIGIIISDDRCKKQKSSTNNNNLKDCLANMDSLVNNIITKETLPKEINIVLASSRIKEGININDTNITSMFCEAHNFIDIAQFAGRYRKNIKTLYIIYDTNSHYSTDDIENIDLEYDYLSTFELDNINIYSSILLYKATGIKTSYLTNSNLQKYSQAVKQIHISLNTKKFLFLKDKNRTLEELDEFNKKYYQKLFYKFQEYIQMKFPLIRYNIISNKYELYYARYLYIKEEFKNYIDFKETPLDYLYSIFKIKNISIEDGFDANTSNRNEYNWYIILYYLMDSNLLNTPLSREKQNEILEEIYSLENISLEKKYTTLGRLLKAYGFSTERVGAHKDGKFQIIYYYI